MDNQDNDVNLEPQRPSLRHLIAVLIILVICVCYSSFVIYHEINFRWARIPDQSPAQTVSIKRQIEQKLRDITDGEVAKRGGSSHVLDLTASCGKSIEIYVVEGEFTDTLIDPVIIWQTILKGSSLLLNSVDELHSNNGGISELISSGCGLQSLSETPAQIGDLDMVECKGSYKDELRIKLVGNAAIIIWEGYGEKFPCGALTSIPESDRAYSDCIAPELRKAIQKLFDNLRLRSKTERMNTFIFPAIGTGTGHVSKELFYQAVKGQLLEELQQPNDRYILPERFILHVWRGESPEKWISASMSIANAISELHDDWNRKDHNRTDLTVLSNLVGVSLALLVVVLLLGLKIPYPKLIQKELTKLAGRNISLVTLGWALASLGSLSLLQSMAAGLIGRVGIPMQIAYGVLAVLACILFQKAKSAIEIK